MLLSARQEDLVVPMALGIVLGTVFLVLLIRVSLKLLGGVFGIGSRGGALTQQQLATLHKYSTFMESLGPEDRKRFVRCVTTFMNDKEWVGAGMQLADEMKVMISASAAQLLYCLPELALMHFTRIMVYPDAYRSPRSDDLHQGTVIPGAGIIKISWKHFLHGYADPDDAHNVALHEMAHALWFEHLIPNAEDDFLDPVALADWNRLAMTEIQMVRAGESRLFRRYAGTNEAEFFACAVEYFFECTAAFKEKMPAEYDAMCGLLKQDPAKNPG